MATGSSQRVENSLAEPSFAETLNQNILRLLKDGGCTDCTLIAGDASLEVHKTVLVANSPFFRRILTKQTHVQHPTFFFDKMDQQVLNWLVEMIYSGNANVPVDQMDKFLQHLRYFEMPYITIESQRIHSGRSTTEDLFVSQNVGAPVAGKVYRFKDSTEVQELPTNPAPLAKVRRASQLDPQHCCQYCFKSFPSKQYLELHLDYCQSNPNGPKFYCDSCMLNCANAVNFNRHLASRSHARNSK